MNRGNYCSDSSFCFRAGVVLQLVEIFHLLFRGRRAESDLLRGITQNLGSTGPNGRWQPRVCAVRCG